jgi:hypothetical protein
MKIAQSNDEFKAIYNNDDIVLIHDGDRSRFVLNDKPKVLIIYKGGNNQIEFSNDLTIVKTVPYEIVKKNLEKSLSFYNKNQDDIFSFIEVLIGFNQELEVLLKAVTTQLYKENVLKEDQHSDLDQYLKTKYPAV